jgi:hypothetical protein
MSFFVNKLGPMPDNNYTAGQVDRTTAEREKLAASRVGTAAPAAAVAQASAQAKVQQAQAAKAPPPAPAPEPEKKKKGWF